MEADPPSPRVRGTRIPRPSPLGRSDVAWWGPRQRGDPRPKLPLPPVCSGGVGSLDTVPRVSGPLSLASDRPGFLTAQPA